MSLREDDCFAAQIKGKRSSPIVGSLIILFGSFGLGEGGAKINTFFKFRPLTVCATEKSICLY